MESHSKSLLFLCCWLGLLSVSTSAPRQVLYKLDSSWPLNTDVFTGKVFSVDIDDKTGEIYVSQRGVDYHPVVVFSEDGELKRVFTFDTSIVSMIHGLRVFHNVSSGQTSVWVTDVGNATYGHTVKKISTDGKLELVLGTAGIAGSSLSPLQFGNVADLAFSEKGEMYVVDGDGGVNNRLLKLSQVQAFDADTGKFIGKWTSCFSVGQPYSVRMSKDKTHFIVALLQQSKILLVATPPSAGPIGDCKVLGSIDLPENTGPHLVGVSKSTGAFYVAELNTQTCQKFVPIGLHRINID
ncbi:NHL repeat-containing protein 3-like [Anneissia japonica]|uniref:NHL repeat-containing protein 3-like n=1 Tax=Anneissia japonica TaxID=1529436 RepID=UPI001425B879|nr:NHL repeat-containing protein 3-like [Anneissia japonica]